MFQREFILRHLRPSVLIDQSLDSLRQTSRQILQLGNLPAMQTSYRTNIKKPSIRKW